MSVIGIPIGALGGAVLGWIFGRRKLNADAQGQELKNVERVIAIYQKAITDVQAQFAAYRAEAEARMARMEAKMTRLEKELEECRKQHRHD